MKNGPPIPIKLFGFFTVNQSPATAMQEADKPKFHPWITKYNTGTGLTNNSGYSEKHASIWNTPSIAPILIHGYIITPNKTNPKIDASTTPKIVTNILEQAYRFIPERE